MLQSGVPAKMCRTGVFYEPVRKRHEHNKTQSHPTRQKVARPQFSVNVEQTKLCFHLFAPVIFPVTLNGYQILFTSVRLHRVVLWRLARFLNRTNYKEWLTSFKRFNHIWKVNR